MSEDDQPLDGKKEAIAVSPASSFSINSILSNHNDDVETRNDTDKTSEEDVPAVISKLEFPAFPMLGKLPLFSRGGEGTGLSLGHLPSWYHWYASQQCLQQLQHNKRKLPPPPPHLSYLGLNARKPAFGVSDKARLKPVSSPTETS